MSGFTFCQQCGLPSSYAYTSADIALAPLNPVTGVIFCMGHSEPKHDGKLGSGECQAKVEINDIDFINMICLCGGYGDDEASTMYLDAKQALSLLTWLQQNKAMLERLAEEKGSEV